MHRWDIINHFIEKYNYKSYLEIGYYKGWSFDNVKCEEKTAVDPNPCKDEWMQQVQYGMWIGVKGGEISKRTSDEFFADIDTVPLSRKWDIIFIDGLHEASQVTKDIENALSRLAPGGSIILHDVNPPTLEHTTTGDKGGNWNGDCYKAFILAQRTYPQYEFYTIDTDWGCGVINPSKESDPGQPSFVSDLIDVGALDNWEVFDKHRKQLLNLISVEEFLKKTDEGTTNSNLSA